MDNEVFTNSTDFERVPSGSRMAANLTPVVVALVTLLVIAFLVVSYYRVFLASCWFFRNNISLVSPSNPETSSTPGAPVLVRMARPIECLPGSVIEKIPIFKFSSLNLLVMDDCPVCLTEFHPEDNVKILPGCNHGFHLECIDEWLSMHSTLCPLCRSKVDIDPASTFAVVEDIPAPRQVEIPLVIVVNPLDNHETKEQHQTSPSNIRWKYLRRVRSTSSTQVQESRESNNLRGSIPLHENRSSSGNGSSSSSHELVLEVGFQEASFVNHQNNSNIDRPAARSTFSRMRRSLSSNLVFPFRHRLGDVNPMSQV